jgi:type III secretory pathway component EscS
MKKLLTKRLFMNVYFPIAIPVGAVILIIFAPPLIVALIAGVFVGILIQFIINKRRESLNNDSNVEP